jgi:lysine biosynthesis protein LysW
MKGVVMSKKCPVCNSDLQLKYPVTVNQQVICTNCGLELEVIWLYPLELAKVLNYKADPTKKKGGKRKSKH